MVKNGQPVRMSKRAGTVLTLEDLVEAVGVDAARSFPRVVASAAYFARCTVSPATLKSWPGSTTGSTPNADLPLPSETMTDLNRSPLWLVEATQIVLRNGLELLGVSAPESM